MRAYLFVVSAFLLAILSYFVAGETERILLVNTAVLIGAVELITLPIAGVLAWIIARTNVSGRSAMAMMLGSLLFVPVYLQLAGWDAALGRQGWHTHFFNELADPWLSGWRGAIFVHSVYALPWATLLMTAAFASGQREAEETALLDGSAWQTFACATWPQLQGGIAIASIWIGVVTAGEMTVTNIYMVHTYAEDIYNFFNLNADLESAIVHERPMLLFTGAMLFLAFASLNATNAVTEQSGAYQWRVKRGRVLLPMLCWFLILVLTFVPVGNLIERLGTHVVSSNVGYSRSWSLAKAANMLVTAPVRFAEEFATTFWLSLGVASASLALGGVLCLFAKGRARSAIAWAIATIGLALPAPVVGLMVIRGLNQPHMPLLLDIYDSPLAPALAILVRTVPVAFIALWWARRTLDPQVLEAAALDGASFVARVKRIVMPLVWPFIAVSGLATFVLASGDLSASILTLPPGYSTVAYRMFGLIHAGVDDQVAAIGLVCWMGYLMMAGVCFYVVLTLRVRKCGIVHKSFHSV